MVFHTFKFKMVLIIKATINISVVTFIGLMMLYTNNLTLCF